MGKFIDLTGRRFERLIAVRYVGGKGSKWLVRCDCSNETEVEGGHLRTGHSTSCGCLHTEQLSERSTTHGLSKKIPEYRVWLTMRERCNNPKAQRYNYYGARGIRVCERWGSFELFIQDMGRRPSPKHSIDRIDNDGNYEPGNCRWATQDQQIKNSRKKGTAHAHP